MASKIWCLLLDHNHEPTFGEPFPVSINHPDTIHDVKIKIKTSSDRFRFHHFIANDIEIWKCKSFKLSANDSFGQTKKKLGHFKFDDENSDVEHLGVARAVMEMGLMHGELLLALIPRNPYVQFLCFMLLNEFPMSHIAYWI